MADQIPYDDDPIWQLTPTELNVAYLSLTLSKKDIADRLSTTDTTVGTHLTKIFSKLGLSDFPDDEKRVHLKLNFGEKLERLVAEINADYQGKYRKLRNEALERKNAIDSQSRTEGIPPAQPTMQEHPPHPRMQIHDRTETARRGLPRIVWFMGAFFVFFVLCGFVGFNIFRGILNLNGINPPQEPTTTVSIPTTARPIVTDTATPVAPSQTVEPSLTVTFTAVPPSETPALVATARNVSLPIREDFVSQYADIWETFGNPIVTDNLGVFGNFKGGILTAEEDETAKIVIANTDWTNYIVSVRAHMPFRNTEMLIGVRVRDMNNMIALSYSSFTRFWTWVVVEDGVWDQLPGDGEMYMEPVTITVEGDTFTAVGTRPGLNPKTMSFILSQKYKNKFPSGGVLLQVTGQMEIDYIEIHSAP